MGKAREVGSQGGKGFCISNWGGRTGCKEASLGSKKAQKIAGGRVGEKRLLKQAMLSRGLGLGRRGWLQGWKKRRKEYKETT